MDQQDNQNVEDFQTVLTKLDLKSLLALQVMIAQQALRVSLKQGLPVLRPEEKKTGLIKPNNKLVL